MWCLGLLLFLVTVSKQLSISEFEVPNTVRAGDDALLQCRYELSPNESDKALFVKWWWTAINGSSDERSQLYQRIAGHDPVAIHHDIEIAENDDILLLNVSVKDSGIYECEVSNIDEDRKYEKLIVYTGGNGIDLDVSTTDDGPDEDENEDLVVSCQATAVAPFPVLTITVAGEMINTTNLVLSSSEDLYDISSNATLNSDTAAGSEVTCRLTFLDVNDTDVAFMVTEIYNGTVSKQLSISEFEVPNTVRAGDDALLQCRYELSPNESDKALFVKWWWTAINGSSDERSQLYQRIAGHDPVAIHHDIEIAENDDILLLNVSVKDSGIYECEVSNIDEDRKYEKLIVYTGGNGIDLDVSTTDDGPDEDENEDLVVSCQATAVAPFPVLTITVAGEMINTTNLVLSSSEDLYDISSNATLNSDTAAGSEVTCRLTFLDVNDTDVAFMVTEIYNGTGFTTESPTEMASTEAMESVDINSKSGISLSWTLIAMAFSAIYYQYL